MEVQLTMVVDVEDLPEIGEALRPFSLGQSTVAHPASTDDSSASLTLGDVLSPSPTADELEWVATAFLNAIPEAQKLAAWLATRPTTSPPTTYTYEDLGEGADLPYDRERHGDDRVGPSLQSLRIQARKADRSFTLVEKRRESRTNKNRYWMKPEVAAVIRRVIGATDQDVG